MKGGIMEEKRYVYVITNLINNKQYVGQSKNPEQRFKQHCYHNKKNYTSLISCAIQKYGKDNFKMEILYYGPEYNEKEIYYISKLNTLTPDGYNIATGGEKPPYLHGTEIYFCKLTNEEADEIKKELMAGNSVKEVQKKYNKVTESTIGRINRGDLWYDDKLKYPLVEIAEDVKLSEKTVKNIINDIKNTTLTLKEIGKKYNVCKSTVVNINNGYTEYAQKNEKNFPIRKSNSSTRTVEETKELADKIIDDILNKDLSFSKIAKNYNVSNNWVGKINAGKTQRRENLVYPLRKK